MRKATTPRTMITLASLVLALSLTAGTGLARLVFFNTPVSESTPASGPEVTLVRHFYAAVNEMLQTGSTERLVDLVAADLIEHPGRPGTSPGRAGLIETLTAMRAIYPALQVVVEDVRSDGDQVAARVRMNGTAGRFLGFTVGSAQVPWGPIDLFRIADGAIVEHWGVPSNAAHFMPLTRGVIHSGEFRRRISLEQRTYAPHTRWPREMAVGPVLIMGQTGTMTVSVDRSASTPAQLVHKARPDGRQTSEPIGDNVIATLVPGDLLILPQATRFSTMNHHDSPAAILILTLEAPAVPGGMLARSPVPPEGITTQSHVMGPALLLPSDAIVQIGRVALSPGSEVPMHSSSGPELLIVESGTLTLTAIEKTAWVRHGADRGPVGENISRLQPGDGAMIPPGSVATYRNTGANPTTVFMITIVAAE